jgi:hypothetical protein
MFLRLEACGAGVEECFWDFRLVELMLMNVLRGCGLRI